MKKLPQNIVDHLNKNLLFNKFGLVNISAVKAHTECDIPSGELEQMIQEKFGKDMMTGKVEFVKH